MKTKVISLSIAVVMLLVMAVVSLTAANAADAGHTAPAVQSSEQAQPAH